MTLDEIRAALDAELEATPEFYDFKVQRREAEGPLWRVTLQPGYVFAEGRRGGLASAQALLDDSLDGATAWWGAPQRGTAGVLALSVEDDQLLLHNASSPPPAHDQLIRLYPTRFLRAVTEAWWDAGWAAQALQALDRLERQAAGRDTGWAGGEADAADGPVLTGSPFRWLRPGQRQALGLLQQRCAFLWGPPGTGKTTTLGVMLAEYLELRPQARVLLLSTTNAAVDLATLAVDKALHKGRREVWRAGVQRLGTRFQAAAYVGREHLIPADALGEGGLIQRLARAEAARPATRDPQALKAWSDRVAALRLELRHSAQQVLRRCRLAAMTTTRAVGTLRSLRELGGEGDATGGEPPFDLLVFDEASQVSLAHTLALLPLGRAWLFAGDPSQLSPVLRSPEPAARRWLGRSAFSLMPRSGSAVVRLEEQSRMAEPISALVSDLFYDGSLRVADDAARRADWRAARQRPLAQSAVQEHLLLHELDSDGAWSATERGPVRRESAEFIAVTVAAELATGRWQPQELIVLTPFRAQRSLIRQCLQQRGVNESVKVSTVHRAQGSEAPGVIFDPVDGRSPFLNTEEALRLFNVAFSRAQARLLVCLSPADRAHPVLAALLQRRRLAADRREPLELALLAAQPGFPASALGQRVRAGRHCGEVSRISPDGRQFWLVNERSGAEQLFDTAFWQAKARALPRP
ncbi:MAG: AAA family ATPase [Burkholderiales bacterium]|nr:AAA family ATPase [Burkholderiales bacterium]